MVGTAAGDTKPATTLNISNVPLWLATELLKIRLYSTLTPELRKSQ